MTLMARAIKGTEMQQKLFNQSCKVKIMPLVINGFGVYTHTQIHTQAHPHLYARMKVISRNQSHAWLKNIDGKHLTYMINVSLKILKGKFDRSLAVNVKSINISPAN